MQSVLDEQLDRLSEPLLRFFSRSSRARRVIVDMHWMNLHESEARRLLAILLVSQEIAHKKLRKIIMLSGMADSLRQAPMISMCWDKERWGDNLFFLFGVTLGVTSAQKIRRASSVVRRVIYDLLDHGLGRRRAVPSRLLLRSPMSASDPIA